MIAEGCRASEVSREALPNPVVIVDGVVIEDLDALILQQNPYLAFPRRAELPVTDGFQKCQAEKQALMLVAWIVDMILPITQLVLALALKMSPVGVRHENGNWINAPVTNSLALSAYSIQMTASFLLSFRLLSKRFECPSMRNCLYCYGLISLVTAVIMATVTISTLQILNKSYYKNPKDSASAIEIIYTVLSCMYFFLRFIGCVFFEKTIVNINSHDNGLHRYCNNDPNFFCPTFNISSRSRQPVSADQELC